jgi:F-type H+-transporting ATPase subunit delta
MTQKSTKDSEYFGSGVQRLGAIYAEALLNVAIDRGQVDEVGQELDLLIDEVFRQSPDFETLLGSRAIRREQKTPILTQAFQGRCSELFFDFLLVLNNHDRLELLRAIRKVYRTLQDVRANRIRVRVQVATEMNEEQIHSLRQTLEASLKMEPLFDIQLNPDLLGGMIIQMGDEVYDTSVRTRLETIRTELLSRSNYEIQSKRDRFSYSG